MDFNQVSESECEALVLAQYYMGLEMEAIVRFRVHSQCKHPLVCENRKGLRIEKV